jgi:hypothetical protein
LEQLLESLYSCEEDKDTRTNFELARDIGILETVMLACSQVDPQKTALRLFNNVYPEAHDKVALLSPANLEY